MKKSENVELPPEDGRCNDVPDGPHYPANPWVYCVLNMFRGGQFPENKRDDTVSLSRPERIFQLSPDHPPCDDITREEAWEIGTRMTRDPRCLARRRRRDYLDLEWGGNTEWQVWYCGPNGDEKAGRWVDVPEPRKTDIPDDF